MGSNLEREFLIQAIRLWAVAFEKDWMSGDVGVWREFDTFCADNGLSYKHIHEILSHAKQDIFTHHFGE